MTASLSLLLIHLLFLYKLFHPGWLLIWAAVSMNLLLLTVVYLGCVRHFLGYVILPANNLRAFRNPKIQAACHNNYIQISKSRNQISVFLKTFQMISRCNQIWEPAAELKESSKTEDRLEREWDGLSEGRGSESLQHTSFDILISHHTSHSLVFISCKLSNLPFCRVVLKILRKI